MRVKEKELLFVAEIDRSDQSYCFDSLRVVKSEDGRYFYGTDSGCSCPSPFENFHRESDWTPLTKHPDSLSSFKASVGSWADGSSYLTAGDVSAFIDEMTALVK